MRHRIRAAALITEKDSILLVKHSGDGYQWWAPPGGGVEGDESLPECAAREVLEETGLGVSVGQLVYVREFIELRTDTHHVEAFFMADVTGGRLKPGIQPDGSDYVHVIKEVRFVGREELPGLKLYPDELVTEFWNDLKAGFPVTRYLGLEFDDD